MLNVTQNPSVAIAFRWPITAVFVFWVLVPDAPAQRARAVKPSPGVPSISGVYNGSYASPQGLTKFKLSITQQDNGTLSGIYTVYLQEGPATNAYTCKITGHYIPANRMVQIIRDRWQTAPPSGVVISGLYGIFDPDGGNGAGAISGKIRARPGPQFQAIRDPAESAKLADAATAPDAQPKGRPTAAKPAAPAPSSAAGSAAEANPPTAINGVYTGAYECAGAIGVGGNFKAKLSLKSTDDGSLTGLFTFDLPAKAGSGSATYKLTGRYVAGSRWPFQFTTVEPLGKPAPDFYAITSLSARFALGPLVMGRNGQMEYSINPDHISGPVTGHAGIAFGAKRDKAESADLDHAMAAQASAATTNAPSAPVVHPIYEGVYNGTYAGQKGPTKIQLTLWLLHENRTTEFKLVNTEIAGLLSVFARVDSGTMAYTAEVHGSYNPANQSFQVTLRRWEPPPSGVALPMTGLRGKFDPAGPSGVREISGFMMDSFNSKFQVVRDAAQSANMDIERLQRHVRPGINGVFNGTYARANEPPAKFKLTIKHNGDGPMGLAGMATIYLPTDSGTQGYSYDLKGVETGNGEFQLTVHDWATPPPKNFKDLRSMGFDGKIVFNDALTGARIISAPPSNRPQSFFVSHFEANWEKTESADINGAIAAQKALGNAEQVAAMKARDQMMANAPPKELASKDLVRKSWAYWDAYDTDMIREVFDGGFGAAIDENEEFQKVFCTYVDMFSAKCPECLPANHQTVTITERTNRKVDQFGNLVHEDVRTFTVEMDSRFVDKYVRFHNSLMSNAAGLRGLVAAAQPGGAQRIIHGMLALASDMQRFFTDHGPKSAAMRQMNENFLRAINGEPSLQQAGGKIDGAEAESDKNLPPGRFARLVDAANAFDRERANAQPTKYGHSASHDTAFNQRLAELYQNVMTRQEEYYYANDFKTRFFDQIMQSRGNCTDPAWPRLHPAIEKALAEIR